MVNQLFLLSLLSMTSLLSASSSNESQRDTTLSILRSANYAEIDVLLQRELDSKGKQTKQDTLAHLAIETGKFKVVKYLIEKTSKQSKTNKFLLNKGKYGNNLLARACIYGDEGIVRYFLESCPFKKGSLIERQFLYNRQMGEPNKHSAENIAREYNFANIAQLIANHTKNLKRNPHKSIGHVSKNAEDTPLHIAIVENDLGHLKKCISKAYNNSGTYKALLAKGKYGYNSLGRAAFHGDITIVQYLLTQCPFRKGTKIRAQYFNNHSSGIANRYSAAAIAEAKGHTNIAQLIKSHSPQPTTSSGSSTTTTQAFMGTQSPTKVLNLTHRKGRGRPRKKRSSSSASSTQTQTMDNDERRGKKRGREKEVTITVSTAPPSNNKRQQTMHDKNIAQVIAFENISQLPCFREAMLDDARPPKTTEATEDEILDLNAFESFLDQQNKESFSLGLLGDH